ncbi:hypothetical protein JAAARDRAFT_60526 [Jaapia argillacea MUCL 33604]|uniref:Uncharacterized protein n=1 Tax=Jaapia argillacea MUCL 33604 TaxID=933084 RepID=A0A067PI07_9AGAM|nr:hypothetical protein JAAARDRAFT_60526 [Jaapia argillacea MUCL 33604]
MIPRLYGLQGYPLAELFSLCLTLAWSNTLTYALVKSRDVSVPACGDNYAWMNNSMTQSPCLVVAYLVEQCTIDPSPLVPPLQPGQSYSPASQSTGELCSCSWAAYNLLSACTVCQGENVLGWEAYSADCGNIASTTTYFPSSLPIPNDTILPYWSTTNPKTWPNATFDVTTAQNISSAGHADVRNPPQSKKVSTAAIIVGLLGFISACILMLPVYLRRRKRGYTRLRPTLHRAEDSSWSQSTYASSGGYSYPPPKFNHGSDRGSYHSAHTQESSFGMLPRDSRMKGLDGYDRGTLAKVLTMLTLFLSILFGAGLIVASENIRSRAAQGKLSGNCNLPSSWIQAALSEKWACITMQSYWVEACRLGLNIVVAIITEASGYVHSVSLTWALCDSRTLEFNANLRLFQPAGSIVSLNGYIFNAIFAISLVVSYVSSSFVFVAIPTNRYSPGVIISYLPLMVLGIAILLQSVLAVFAVAIRNVYTWSSSPLDIAMAAASTGSLTGTPRRCMRSVIDCQNDDTTPIPPSTKQPSPWNCHQDVHLVVYFVWGLIVVGAAWGVFAYNRASFKGSWSFLPSSNSPLVYLSGYSPGLGLEPSLFWMALAVVTAAQAVLTLGLHCCELLVVLTRDEKTWRRASESEEGTKPRNPVLVILTSWQSMTLLIAKPIIHWLFGNAVSLLPIVLGGLVVRPYQVFNFTASLIPLALFITVVAIWGQSGSQPCAYGHIPTLLDLVDEWSPQMYWGDKGAPDGGAVRHAGTSTVRLGPVWNGCLYAGSRRDLRLKTD